MNQSTKDRWAIFFGLLFITFLVVMVPVGIWLQVAAPCHLVDWMPVKDVPARCLR